MKKPNKNKPIFRMRPCKKDIHEEDFQDELSRNEYSISGMCQECQNEVFGGV